MIYITGDTHGSGSRYYSPGGYTGRFSEAAFPEQKDMTKEDYVIICGDFGGVWQSNRNAFEEKPDEKRDLDWLEQRPFTTLFVPGNHENYDRLMGCHNEKLLNSWAYGDMPETEKERFRKGYPRKSWHGGKVREIRPSVLMLERGYVFDIDGLSCFAFGGARSHDIQDGILKPYHYDTEKLFEWDYSLLQSRMIRVEGFSWWAEEMPSAYEMNRGRKNIGKFLKNHEKIDLIITHEAPASDLVRMAGGYKADRLNEYLEELRSSVPYGRWFYGHYHDNKQIRSNHYLLYEQIVRAHR